MEELRDNLLHADLIGLAHEFVLPTLGTASRLAPILVPLNLLSEGIDDQVGKMLQAVPHETRHEEEHNKDEKVEVSKHP